MKTKSEIQHLNDKDNKFFNLKTKAVILGGVWYYERKLGQINERCGLEDDQRLINLQYSFDTVLEKKKWNCFYKFVLRKIFNIVKYIFKFDNAYETIFFETIEKFSEVENEQRGNNTRKRKPRK